VALTTSALLGLVPASASTSSASSQHDDTPPAEWLTSDRGGLVPRAEAATGALDRAANAKGTKTVVVEAVDERAARAAVDQVGGTVELALSDRVKADVPAASLDELEAAAGVTTVRDPYPIILDTISEGVAETQASIWQTAGLRGAGTKVAILDGGFTDYASRLGTELPASVETDFSRCNGPFTWQGTSHGTAVAEIVHDMAPDAAVRLICIDDDIDFVSALGTMLANGVDVVNGSFGFYLTGRGDGSGSTNTVSGAAAKLRDEGILYVASAGNSEGRHYNVNAFGDPFPAIDNPEDLDLVNISPDDVFTVTVAAQQRVYISMKWDAWPTTRQDFDIYVGNDTCGLMGAGFDDQASAALPPVEFVTDVNGDGGFVSCSNATSTFEVIVDRWSGATTPRLDLFFDGGVLAIEHTSSGSVAEPASSPSVMAVGAHCVGTGAIQPYSSRGPTIDGRTKPDITGPDATSSSVYGPLSGCQSGFTGTSASSPHVAGAAALMLESNPGLDVAELQQLLEDHALDSGTAGKDSTFGSGRLRLGTAGDSLLPTPQAFTGITPVRIFDSRPGTQYPAESPNRTTPLGPNGKVRVRVRNIVGVPGDATAVVLNVTAVAPTAAGYVTVHPGGAVPNASNLNFAPGQTVAVHVTATVASDDMVELVNAVGSTHLVVDLAGWYGPTGSGGPSTNRLTLLATPGRAMDSRAGTLGYAEAVFGPSGRTTPVPAGGELAVQVAGLGGVPADATAVVMNVTAVGATKSTWITAYPGGQARPVASSLNLAAGRTVANLVVLPVGPGGVVRFYNEAGDTHLIVDVTGWFQPGVGAGYVALDPPTRDLDTRTGTGLRLGALRSGSTYRLKVARYNGVPADAAAVMLGVVAVSPTTSGYLTVYPGSAALPATSSLNFPVNGTVANAVVARLGTDGTVAFTNSAGSTHVISDLAGYFIDPANQPQPLN